MVLDGALPPNCRVTALVVDSDDDYRHRCDTEEDGVWKAAHHALPKLAVNLGKGLGAIRDRRHRRIEGPGEVLPKPLNLLVVPRLGLANLSPRLRPKGNVQRHSLRS